MRKMTSLAKESTFTDFVRSAEPRLSVALTAAYGPETGHEATAEALSHAWTHWDKVRVMTNPIGYLYRVGQSKAGRFLRWTRKASCPAIDGLEHAASAAHEPWIEPGLPKALAKLSQQQRLAVVLVCGFDWTQAEVAELVGVSRTTIEQHLQRGLSRLRRELRVTS